MPAILSPTPSSTVTASPMTIQGSGGSGVAEYWLQVGTTSANRKDMDNQSAGTNTSASDLPPGYREGLSRLPHAILLKKKVSSEWR